MGKMSAYVTRPILRERERERERDSFSTELLPLIIVEPKDTENGVTDEWIDKGIHIYIERDRYSRWVGK